MAELRFGKMALFVTALFLGVQLVHMGRGHGLSHFLLGEFPMLVMALALRVEFIGIRHSRTGQRDTASGGDEDHFHQFILQLGQAILSGPESRASR